MIHFIHFYYKVGTVNKVNAFKQTLLLYVFIEINSLIILLLKHSFTQNYKTRVTSYLFRELKGLSLLSYKGLQILVNY